MRTLLTLLLAPLLFHSIAAADGPADDALQAARTAWGKGDLQATLGQADVAIAAKKDFPAAFRDYFEALARNRNDPAAWRGWAQTNTATLKFDKAIECYNEAIKIEPNSSINYKGRGYVYFIKSNHNSALADFNKAVELAPG